MNASLTPMADLCMDVRRCASKPGKMDRHHNVLRMARKFVLNAEACAAVHEIVLSMNIPLIAKCAELAYLPYQSVWLEYSTEDRFPPGY